MRMKERQSATAAATKVDFPPFVYQAIKSRHVTLAWLSLVKTSRNAGRRNGPDGSRIDAEIVSRSSDNRGNRCTSISVRRDGPNRYPAGNVIDARAAVSRPGNIREAAAVTHVRSRLPREAAPSN